jgi:hypothetical protein
LKSTNKFLHRADLLVRQHETAVSFNTPLVTENPPILTPVNIFYHHLSHQLKDLSGFLLSGIAVAQRIDRRVLIPPFR